MPYSSMKIDRSTVLTARRGDHTVVASVLDILMATAAKFNYFVATVSDAETVYQPDALKEFAAKAIEPAVKSVGKDISEFRAKAREMAIIEARQMEIPKTVPTERLPEIRAKCASMSIGEMANFLQAATLEELSALMNVPPSLVPMNEHLQELAVGRFKALAHIERSGLGADFELKPSLDNILATGMDRAAAEGAANEAIKAFVARKEELADTEASLRSVIDFIAFSVEKQPEDILAQALVQ